jgi:hypothetical protein
MPNEHAIQPRSVHSHAMGPGSRARAIALLATGMLVVHQLRFMLAYGGNAGPHLAQSGHAYLGFVLPFVGVVLALACAHFAVLVARRREPRFVVPRPSLLATWVAASATLLLAYATQEGVEGTLALGHPAGIAGIFGAGGWIAVPLSVAVGAVVALLLHGAGVALAHAAARSRPRPARTPAPRRRLPLLPEIKVGDPLARHLSGRAPPRWAY